MVDRFDCFEPLATCREKGEYVRYSDYAALEARAEAAERALAERAGGVRPLPERAPYEVLQVLGREYETTGDMWAALRDALTTEPSAPEERQEAVAWRAAMPHGWAHTSHAKQADEWSKVAPVQPLFARPTERAVTEADLLAEMAKHLNWELDWGNLDPSDETSECGWRVHARNGGRNDREWTLVGSGETPAAALKAAMGAGHD